MEKKIPKHCPNCLSTKTEIVLDHSHFGSKRRLRWYGFCYGCGNKGELGNSFGEALENWNSQTRDFDKVDKNPVYSNDEEQKIQIDWANIEKTMNDLLNSCKTVPKRNHNSKRAVLQYLLDLSGQKIDKKDSTDRLLKKFEKIDFEKLEKILIK